MTCWLCLSWKSQVAALQPNFERLAQLDALGVIATVPGEGSICVSLFCPVGVPEDPVTGSSHCTLIPYWAYRLGKEPGWKSRQISARGELACELVGERVKIGGRAVLVHARDDRALSCVWRNFARILFRSLAASPLDG